MTKSEYIKALMMKRMYDPRLANAAFVFWHSGVELVWAIGYMNTLEQKLITGSDLNGSTNT